MKIIFPNPAGFKLPTKASVLAYQKQQGFSDQYADFLITQNGFSFKPYDANSDVLAEYAKYSSKSDNNSEGHSDLSALYGFESGDEYYDLVDNQQGLDIFKGVFFLIGVGYGGNDYVEVLAGKYKGYIGSLDHDMYAGAEDLDEFIDNMELDGYQDAPLDEQANMLADPDLGLLWLHAKSMKEFVADCIHCDENGTGFARDADSIADLDS
jgi:hypothetical protein